MLVPKKETQRAMFGLSDANRKCAIDERKVYTEVSQNLANIDYSLSVLRVLCLCAV